MKKKVSEIIALLEQKYPEAPCALHYTKDYELMIAVRLSAQCTDARVNLVTPALFAAYPTLEAMASAPISHVEELVHSCGFYKHKARDIVLGCQMLLTDYGGKVPGTMEELLRIPGVGRKTANLIVGDVYGKPGVVVDTHCMRLSKRMGITKETEQHKIEKDLVKKIPKDYQTLFCHQLVEHGRKYCQARTPHCEECCLGDFCRKKIK